MQNLGFIGVLLLFIAFSIQAQNETTYPPTTVPDYNNGYSIEESAPTELPQVVTGTIAIAADPRIDALIQAHVSSSTIQQGYRVQVFQNTNRNILREEQARFIQLYLNLGLRTYEVYEPPLFKLRIGDFTDRFLAYGIAQQLKSDFPSAFVIEDGVN